MRPIRTPVHQQLGPQGLSPLGRCVRGVAAVLRGSVLNEVTCPTAVESGRVRIGHPCGVLEVSAAVEQCAAGPAVLRVAFVRTARRIMDGAVYAGVDRPPSRQAGAGATAPAEGHDTGDGSIKAGSVLSGPAPLVGAGIQTYTPSHTAQPRRVRTVWDEVCVKVKTMSQCLDERPALVGLVDNDLRRHGVKETGRQGLPAESALGCGLLNHRNILITKTFADRAYRCRSARSSGRKRHRIAINSEGPTGIENDKRTKTRPDFRRLRTRRD